MTVAAFIPEIWSARFTAKLRDRLVWGSRCNRNYEGEIRGAGNVVHVPTGTTDITVRDYAIGSDIADPEVNKGVTTDLTIDKQKYFHFLVDDVDAVQHRPSLMDEAMDEAAFQMALQVDSDIVTEVDKAYLAARSVRVAEDLGEAAGIKALIQGFVEVKRRMTIANIPLQDRWAVIHPDFIAVLEDYFATNANDVYLPATSEQTLRNGFSGMLVGFNLFATTRVPDVTADSKDFWRSYCGSGTQAITHASQIVETEAYRPERRFGDAVKGLRVYGTKTIHADRLFTVEHQKTA